MNKSTNESASPEGGVFHLELSWDDATWIMTSSFIIFTMQTGFGMLECGCVAAKNEANIMMKNVVDVVFGGLTYWIFGFSLSFGTDKGSTPVAGIGEYTVDSDYEIMGPVFSTFMFQLSFATTATTIVSGTMAERCNFKAYCIFSLLNTMVYCVPARWVWGPTGFLAELGCIDIAGSGPVHLLGGASGLMAAKMLGPRLGRYEFGTDPLPLGSPANCLSGLNILWWGWLVFNAGSTFGVSDGKIVFAARAAVTTFVASVGGGLIGSVYTLSKSSRIFQVMDIVNPVLGALVGVTAGCALYHTFDAFVVGVIGGAVVIFTSGFADYFRIDDPVGAVAVHAFGGIWGLIAVGLFTEDDNGGGFSRGNAGLFRGGTLYLLGVQLLACVCIITWAFCITFIILWVINKVIPIRMEPHEELLGADLVEHLVRRKNIGISPILSAVRPHHPEVNDINPNVVGFSNPVHDPIIAEISRTKRWSTLRAVVTFALGWIPAPSTSTPGTKPVPDLAQSRKTNKSNLDFYNYGFTLDENMDTAKSTIRKKPTKWDYKDILGEPNLVV